MKQTKSQSSKRTLKVRVRKKTAPKVTAAILLAIKSPGWQKFAKLISMPTRQQPSVNLKDIDDKVSMGDTVFVPGKVLSLGDITKKIRICSFGISEEALDKLKKTKSEWTHILEEIKKNPKAEGVKLIR